MRIPVDRHDEPQAGARLACRVWGRVMNAGGKLRRQDGRRQSGFTLIELTIVIIVAGLLLVPLIRMAGDSVISDRQDKTQRALTIASEALISHAAANAGCLPFAANSEGGLPDTDSSGTASASPDTGGGEKDGPSVGDLPWLDLGLTNKFLDGNGLRIQYYVASPFSDDKEDCLAGFRGFPHSPNVTYDAREREIFVYAFDPTSGDRTLYEIEKEGKDEWIGILPAGTHPSDAGVDIMEDLSTQMLLPDPLLQVRRGPDVTASAPQDDVISSQNVFILIAPGTNRNVDIDRQFVRDSTHRTAAGGIWALGVSIADDHIFSSEPNIGADDAQENGDDVILVMSFTRFKAEMNRNGLNMEPVCVEPC